MHLTSFRKECMLSISHRSGGSVRIKTASEIAVQLVASWLNPIAEQIDPLRLGEAQRAIAIAKEYGVRIGSKNLNPGALDTLVEGYPSHSFVIDQEEADKLFKNVRSIEEKELEIAEGLSPHTHDPSKEPIVLSLDESGHEKGGDAHEGASIEEGLRILKRLSRRNTEISKSTSTSTSSRKGTWKQTEKKVESLAGW